MSFEVVSETVAGAREPGLVEFEWGIKEDLRIIEIWLASKELSVNSVRAMRFEARRWLCWLYWRHAHEVGLTGYEQLLLKRANSVDGAGYMHFLHNPQPVPDWALWPMQVGTAAHGAAPSKDPSKIQQPWRLQSQKRGSGEPAAASLPGLSKASFIRAKGILRSMYAALIDMSFDHVEFVKNPIPKPSKRSSQQYRSKSPRKKAVLPRERAFVTATLEKLVEEQHPMEPQIRWVWMALTHSGLRRSEFVAATTADLEQDSDDTGHVGWELKVCGKGGVNAVIPLNDVFMDEFRRYRMHLGLSAMPSITHDAQLEATPLLLPYRGDVRQVSPLMAYRYMKQLFQMAATLAGEAGDAQSMARLQQFAAHSARHTFVTTIVATTEDLVSAKEAARHSSIETTMRYVATSKNKTRRAVDAIGAVLRPSSR